MIVVACTDPEKGAQGFSLLVVERGMPGFERGRNLDKIGLDAQDTAELSFDDVRVPAANMLGEEGLGFIYLMQNLPQERLSIAVVAAAAMEQVLEDTIQYCRDRKAFGKPIGRFQNSRFELAELSTEALLAGCSWTSASSCSTSVPSPCRKLRWPSTGLLTSRSSSSTAASSCTAVTATCVNTRLRRRTSILGSRRSTAARTRS